MKQALLHYISLKTINVSYNYFIMGVSLLLYITILVKPYELIIGFTSY